MTSPTTPRASSPTPYPLTLRGVSSSEAANEQNQRTNAASEPTKQRNERSNATDRHDRRPAATTRTEGYEVVGPSVCRNPAQEIGACRLGPLPPSFPTSAQERTDG
jgi:hypothetical protein